MGIMVGRKRGEYNEWVRERVKREGRLENIILECSRIKK